MLNKYKFSISNGSSSINIPLIMNNNNENQDNKEIFINSELQKSINKIENFEKESYTSKSEYKLIYKFFNGSYNESFSNTGFLEEDFEQKNSFTKSLFLLEFYNTPNVKNKMLFNTTLNVTPNPEYGKGCDVKIEGKKVITSTFTIKYIQNELYLLYFNRKFTPEVGKNYISVYMKSIFLNAKTGKAHYFINTENDTIIKSTDLKEPLYYYEIRFYEDFTYAFYKNGELAVNVVLREVATR